MMASPDIQGAVKNTIGIIASVITGIRDSSRLKEQWEALEFAATSCQGIIDNLRSTGWNTEPAKKLDEQIKGVIEFVRECKDYNAAQRFWEVTWDQKLTRLKNEFESSLAAIQTNAVVGVDNEFASTERKRFNSGSGYSLTKLQVQTQRTMQTDHEKILAKLKILDLLNEDRQSNELHVDFDVSDPRLDVNSSNDFIRGKLKASEECQVDVICEPVTENLVQFGQKRPRYDIIYSRLSENTRVHPFYGIAKREKKRYAVFKDMSACSTLSHAIGNGELPTNLAARLAIAREIALTVNYLHSVQIVIKRLSDRSCLLYREGEGLIPYLTNLETARLVRNPCLPGQNFFSQIRTDTCPS